MLQYVLLVLCHATKFLDTSAWHIQNCLFFNSILLCRILHLSLNILNNEDECLSFINGLSSDVAGPTLMLSEP